MTDSPSTQNGDTKSTSNKERSYLIIADETEEFQAALHYALQLAEDNHGHVCILHIKNTQDFMHWGSVEALVRKDLRAESEKILWTIARQCNEINGHIPSLYSREGKMVDVIASVLLEDPRIAGLILASSATGNPGPVISHFTGKALAQMNVPVIIVPGHLDAETIQGLI